MTTHPSTISFSCHTRTLRCKFKTKVENQPSDGQKVSSKADQRTVLLDQRTQPPVQSWGFSIGPFSYIQFNWDATIFIFLITFTVVSGVELCPGWTLSIVVCVLVPTFRYLLNFTASSFSVLAVEEVMPETDAAEPAYVYGKAPGMLSCGLLDIRNASFSFWNNYSYFCPVQTKD